MFSAGLIRPLYRQCTKEGTGNDKQGKGTGNRTLCPSRNFSQAIKLNAIQCVLSIMQFSKANLLSMNVLEEQELQYYRLQTGANLHNDL